MADYLLEKILLLDENCPVQLEVGQQIGVADVREVIRAQFKLQNIINHAFNVYNITAASANVRSPQRSSHISTLHSYQPDEEELEGESEESPSYIQKYH